MKNFKIGILGIGGAYGKWLKNFFENQGYSVVGSDIEGELTNAEVAVSVELIVVAVSLPQSAKVIRELVPLLRPDQLIIDISGLKQEQVAAMLDGKAEVLALHPMCAPTVPNFKGQIVVVCAMRLTQWQTWVDDFLKRLQCELKQVSPEVHDFRMVWVQNMLHAITLVMASALRSQNVKIEETLELSSPFYRIAHSLMGRILKQSPVNYAHMQQCNPYTLTMLHTLQSELNRFVTMIERLIESGDPGEFIQEFEHNRSHFGPLMVDEGFKLFDWLIRLMADLSSNHTLTVETTKDRVGLLAEIAFILAEHGINLTSMHSYKTTKGVKFLIGYAGDADQDLERARQEIEKIL